jgi:NADP-dependent 3-hydroxy acid dehydrogenase YdfG
MPTRLPRTRGGTYLGAMKNANRVAIVTGASRGIGESLVAGHRRLSRDPRSPYRIARLTPRLAAGFCKMHVN